MFVNMSKEKWKLVYLFQFKTSKTKVHKFPLVSICLYTRSVSYRLLKRADRGFCKNKDVFTSTMVILKEMIKLVFTYLTEHYT